MNKQNASPSLIQDLGAIAGLYRTVFHMMSQRWQLGPGPDHRLQQDMLRFDESVERERAREFAGHRHN